MKTTGARLRNCLCLLLLGLLTACSTPGRSLFAPPFTSSPAVAARAAVQPLHGPFLLDAPLEAANADGVVVQLRSLTAEETQIRAVLCYTLPTAEDWQPGEAFLTLGPSLISAQASVLVEPALGNKAGARRCAALYFPYNPQTLPEGSLTLNLTSLVTSPPDGYDCETAQQKLDRKHTGIKVSCWAIDHSAGYNIVSKPVGMSETKARLIAFEEGFTSKIIGPWVFTTSIFTSLVKD
jgi:hypothetical protein